jgi:hypothetical protein
MDEQQSAPALSTAFPAPPPYWQSFTPANLERIAELRAAQKPSAKNYNAATELPLRLLDLPPELRWLQPPVQPPEGTYKCFGDSFDVYILSLTVCLSLGIYMLTFVLIACRSSAFPWRCSGIIHTPSIANSERWYRETH